MKQQLERMRLMAGTSPSILIFGDYLTDRYWIGTTDRVSPEAPIPVIKVTTRFDSPGGAGNVVANLRALGIFGTSYESSPYHPIKNRLMVGDVQIARWDEDDYCVPYEPEFLSLLTGNSRVDAIVIADYNKGSLTPELRKGIRQFLDANPQTPLFVDTKCDPTIYPYEATFFPNAKEFEQYKTEYSMLPKVVLKQGSEGISEMAHGQVTRSVPAQARFVKSVNGAGDSVLSSYVYATLTGMSYPLQFAAICAADVVEQSYTSVPRREKVF